MLGAVDVRLEAINLFLGDRSMVSYSPMCWMPPAGCPAPQLTSQIPRHSFLCIVGGVQRPP